MSHFFKVGDYLRSTSSAVTLIVLGYGKEPNKYLANVLSNGDGAAYTDIDLDVEIPLSEDAYVILSELEKALI